MPGTVFEKVGVDYAGLHSPGTVFEKVGVDYAGLLQVKYGMVRKPVTVKVYICVFVSLTVKG